MACTSGVNLKWLAGYCGTSVDMIERHYSKWLGSADGTQLSKLRPKARVMGTKRGR